MVKRILVVDDEETIRTLLRRVFERAGFQIATASSGTEAIDIMGENPCFVSFIDLQMPEMTGLELCRQLKTDWPTGIFFAITGNPSMFQLSDCREAGFDDYFIKPMDTKVLIDAANAAFDRLERWGKR